jgi:hypothetical protein
MLAIHERCRRLVGGVPGTEVGDSWAACGRQREQGRGWRVVGPAMRAEVLEGRGEMTLLFPSPPAVGGRGQRSQANPEQFQRLQGKWAHGGGRCPVLP